MYFERRKVSPPAGICETCFNDRDATHPLIEGSPVLVSFCEHHQTGGFIQFWGFGEDSRWTLFTPVHQDAWQSFIRGPICAVIEEDHMHLLDARRVPSIERRKIKEASISRPNRNG